MLENLFSSLTHAVEATPAIVLAGTFTEVVQRYMDWNERSKGAVVLRKVCGVCVLAAGLYLIYRA